MKLRKSLIPPVMMLAAIGGVAHAQAVRQECCVLVAPRAQGAAPVLRLDPIAPDAPIGGPVGRGLADSADPFRPAPLRLAPSTLRPNAPGVAMTFTSPLPVAGGTLSFSVGVRNNEAPAPSRFGPLP